jgi:hypothetical protein
MPYSLDRNTRPGAGTYLIEFGMLTRLTGDTRYEAAARGAMRAIWARRSPLNLVGNHIDIRTGRWTLLDSGIGPNQDSFYEYLLKAYVLFGDPEYLAMFEDFYLSAGKHMKHNGWCVRACVLTQPNLSAHRTLSHPLPCPQTRMRVLHIHCMLRPC